MWESPDNVEWVGGRVQIVWTGLAGKIGWQTSPNGVDRVSGKAQIVIKG